MSVILTTISTMLGGAKQRRSRAFSLGLIPLLAALFFLFPVSGGARVTPQEKEREPLGSLTSIGEVYVNDSPAPAEITIFSGDRVRAGESGSATFNMSGKGQLKLAPRSQVLFSGKYEYTALLEVGAVLMNSVSGPSGLTLRIGNDVVVPSIKERSASSAIDRAPDGSFLVTCSDGAVGVLALRGSLGQFLQVGQSVSVAPNGELFPVEQHVAAPEKTTSGRIIKPVRNYKDWSYFGLGGGGAMAAVVALTRGGGKKSVSPSAP